MPSRVFYQIPLATWSYRPIMALACLFAVVAICGWWLPRLIRGVRKQLKESRAYAAIGIAVAVISVAIGLLPLLIFIALIKNPQAYVTDAGVTKENVFSRMPVSFAWGDIRRVYCRSEDRISISSIIIVADDGRRIELGNTGGVDFVSMFKLFENQLGSDIVRDCDAMPKLSH